MTTEIIFAGFGGQGVILAGKILTLAGMSEDKYVSHIPSYGAEMRGGTANCSVIVSDEEVASPVIEKPDVVVALIGAIALAAQCPALIVLLEIDHRAWIVGNTLKARNSAERVELHLCGALGTLGIHVVVAEGDIATSLHALHAVVAVLKGMGTQRGQGSKY